MREYSFTIKDLNGLRVHHKSARNSGGLTGCMNFLPTENGLLPYKAATSLLDDAYLFDILPHKEWPFPQMHHGSVWSLLCFQTKIYSLDITLDPWNPTLVYNFGTMAAWDQDNTWQIADFHDMVVLTNNAAMLWYNPSTTTWEEISGVTDRPVMGTACNYRGQLIGGNFKEAFHDTDSSFVGWGKIGSFDMTPDAANIAGYKPMPFTGVVRKVLPLNKYIIVYGEGGIVALAPGENTFGHRVLAKYGIMSRDAVYGNDDAHVFIDENGWLRKIGVDLQITELGYQEYFEGMNYVTNYPSILFDSNEGDYYISDGDDNYVLTPAGLSEAYQSITSGEFIQGAFVGNILLPADGEEDDLNSSFITTNVYDMGYRARKTVESIEVSFDVAYEANLDDDILCTVSIAYRNKVNEEWSVSAGVLCNHEGVARIPCSGVEFMFIVTFNDFTKINLDYITVKYKATDKRFTRGISHANANAS